ncbi:hypothetical protein ACVWXM_005655 [Bradyrhizobium sp. GM7.3]
MQSALYVGLSAQVALEKRLQTIANNVANVNTAAFRTDVVKFETVLSKAGANPVAFSSPGDNIISREMGSITESGNPLDVAVVGQGWIAFAGPNGTVYTRDGRLQIAANGDLQTVSGFPVIDSGGAQITLDPNGGPVSIARSGAITQDQQRDRHHRPVQHSRRRQSRPLRQFGRHAQPACDRDRRLLPRRLQAGLCRGLGRQSDDGIDEADRGLARLRRHQFDDRGHRELAPERNPDAGRTRQIDCARAQ